jgi:hypothetical protein
MNKPYGLLAEFDTSADILCAAEAVRRAGYRQWDVFTPFPVQGMDEAMGLKRSPVGWCAFFGGTAGFAGGNLMVWWMSAVDYPILVGGKPTFSPLAAFPPSFELAILFGVLGALAGMLFLNRLPRLHHPLLKNGRFKGATCDKFYLVIEGADPQFSEIETRKLLEAAGSRHLEMVED